MPPRETPARRSAAKGPALRFAPIDAMNLSAYVDIVRDAYPLFASEKEAMVDRFRSALIGGYPQLIGAFETDNRMAGIYAYFTFAATILGRGLPATGLGMVGTALDRKKAKVALGVVRDFVRRTRRSGAPLSFLYPFRHDFYAQMGWGPVGESRQHTLPPAAFPLHPERTMVRQVRDPGWEEFDRIHRQAIGRRGALGLSRHPLRWKGQLTGSPLTFLVDAPPTGGTAPREGTADGPEGYLLARFTKRADLPDLFKYDLEVSEMEWLTPRALRALLGFLSSQRDQVVEVVLDWPVDGHLDAVLLDPARRNAVALRNHQSPGPQVGLGVMLRLEDPPTAFALRPYAGPDALRLDVATRDPLRDGAAIRFRADLRGAEASPARLARAALETDLATLSRLWAGSLRVSEAVEFGLAAVAPLIAVEALERLLAVPAPRIVERF
jgi:predicted acetyltransferase